MEQFKEIRSNLEKRKTTLDFAFQKLSICTYAFVNILVNILLKKGKMDKSLSIVSHTFKKLKRSVWENTH